MNPSIDTYFPLHIIFIHLPIAIGDIISDSFQGYKLLVTDRTNLHGMVTFGILWLPGIPAAVHILSTNRTQLGVAKSLTLSALCILFYPLLPIFTYLFLLWRRPSWTPQQGQQKGSEWLKYERTKQFTFVIHSITGGIESPIQLVFQERISSGDVCNILFSILDGLPFLIVTSMFRIVSIILSAVYLYEWTLLPLAVAWISNLIVGYHWYDMTGQPVWLNSFVSLFLPIYYSTEEIGRRNGPGTIIGWHSIFKIHTACTFFIYLSTTITICILVNYKPEFNYSPNVILSNSQLNVIVIAIAAIGCASVLLSTDCSFITKSKRTEKTIQFGTLVEDENDDWLSEDHTSSCRDTEQEVYHIRMGNFELRHEQERTTHSIKHAFLKQLILIVTLGLIAGSFQFCRFMQYPDAFIYYKPYANDTKIIKAIVLNENDLEIHGYKIFYDRLKENHELKMSNAVISAHSERKEHLKEYMNRVILVVSRSDWLQRLQDDNGTSLSELYAAIIIVDDNDACPKVNENCYRPSYPISDLISSTKMSIPVLFVQEIDIFQNFFHNTSSKNHIGHMIGITTQEDSVPIDTFICDVEPNHCLPFKLQNGKIQGRQYRTVSCQWGGMPCLNHPELTSGSQPFCDAFDISEKFCKDANDSFLDTYLCTMRSNNLECCVPNSFDNPCYGFFSDKNPRYYRMKGAKEARENCLNQDNLDLCNKRTFEWSSVTQRKQVVVDGETQYEVKRYCKISEQCLLEEKLLVNQNNELDD